MDFRLSDQEEGFRQEISGFLKRELSPDWEGIEQEEPGISDEVFAEFKRMAKKFGDRGWLTLGWPKEYGGQGRSHVDQLVLKEEVSYHRAPGVDMWGTNMIGPTLIAYGTDEQRRRHLPPIRRGEIFWCQGYSEPSAGSDLASLQTRAVADGDDFVINGSKIWTSNAHRADWMFLGARTDPNAPQHKGITFFLLDTSTPGITVHPLVNMDDYHSFNQVFFDNVRIPKGNVVGEVNRGWYVMAALLDFERSNIYPITTARRTKDDLVAYIHEAGLGDVTRAERAQVRHMLADLAIKVETGRLLVYRIAWMQDRGLTPNHEASMGKLFGSEVAQQTAQYGMRILGLYGQLDKDSKWSKLSGKMKHLYLFTISRTIAAGTSEVQRNVIAIRGLGLPK